MVIKITHTISQPVIDGDSITTGKDTIINETAYDVNGNESAVTDGNGNVTTYTYDDQNRVTGVSRKNGNETISNSISYDMGADGKTTTSVKDANGHVNKEVTNEAGLTESTTDLGDGEEQITTAYSYDTNGNKIRETYADGGYKTFDYDRKNRLIKTESYEAGEAGESIGEKTLKTVYSYDINDRLLESIDYQIDGSEETAVRYTEYQYDRRGQTTGYAELSQENAPTADEIKEHQIRYHYDSDGKLTKVTYPTTKNGVHAVSQCVHAGGKKMKYKNYKKILQYKDMYKTTSYWYSHRYEKWRTNYYVYKWKETSAWVGVEDFCKYWRKHEEKITVTSSLNKMQNKAVRGDVVQFYVKSKGWYHSTIVTAGKKGALKYCAHSNSRRDYKYFLLTKNNAEKYRIIHFK